MSDKYEIRKALPQDLSALKIFIDEHWRPGHIFVSSDELLDWQHKDLSTGHYNFILGIEKSSGEIHGALGFIRLSQFDVEIEADRLIWMAIWKVRDAARGHRLGRNIQSFLVESEKPQVISTVAASAMTLEMYRKLGYQVDTLRQYFILNEKLSEFHLAHVSKSQSSLSAGVQGNRVLKPISADEIMTGTRACFENHIALPMKTPAYINGRYVNHPIYDYMTYKIVENGNTVGLIVTRICENDGYKAIRIVEFIGPDEILAGLSPYWQEMMDQQSAEYIDFYNAGIAHSDLLASGFVNSDDFDDIIIPNYFEPFVQKKVSIDFMISSPVGVPFRVVKGDSDQDRPNLDPGA